MVDVTIALSHQLDGVLLRFESKTLLNSFAFDYGIDCISTVVCLIPLLHFTALHTLPLIYSYRRNATLIHQ